MASWAVGETPNLSPVELYISQTNHFSLIGLLIKSIQPLISGSRLILLIIMDTETTRAEWYIWSYTVQCGCLITRLSQAFHFKMPPVLERRWPSARLGFFLFIRRKPDKVVKVDMLCGLRGGGLHAEELPFSFTVGWEEGGEERKKRRTQIKKRGGNKEVGRLQREKWEEWMWIWRCMWMREKRCGCRLGEASKSSTCQDTCLLLGNVATHIFYPPCSWSTSDTRDDADVTERHLWQCICSSLGSGFSFHCC